LRTRILQILYEIGREKEQEGDLNKIFLDIRVLRMQFTKDKLMDTYLHCYLIANPNRKSFFFSAWLDKLLV